MSRRIKRHPVQIDTVHGVKVCEAEVYGIWGVTNGMGPYTVTHIPTGRCAPMCAFKYPIVPRRLAKKLAERYPELWIDKSLTWKPEIHPLKGAAKVEADEVAAFIHCEISASEAEPYDWSERP